MQEAFLPYPSESPVVVVPYAPDEPEGQLPDFTPYPGQRQLQASVKGSKDKKHRRWVEFFMAVLHDDDSMALLRQRFGFEATRVGPKLVRDVMLRESRCARLVTQGCAGGDKALEDGIFSKLPIAGTLFNDPEDAIKTASLELKTIRALEGLVREIGGGRFHFPLFCVMDFMGHRVSTSFYLPLDDDEVSQVVHNGHKDRWTQDPEVDRFLRRLSDALNLEPHSATHPSGLPFDLEIHKIKDHYFIVDPTRLFPSEERNNFLSRLLRFEFLRRYDGARLYSDAFIPQFASTQRQEASRAALTHLRSKVVPQFAWDRLDDVATLAQLKQAMHGEGINLRYLLLVLHHLRQAEKEEAARLCVAEMVARGVKVLIRRLFNERAQTVDYHLLPQEVARVLTGLLRSPSWWVDRGPDGLVTLLWNKFGAWLYGSNSDNQWGASDHLPQGPSGHALYQTLCDVCCQPAVDCRTVLHRLAHISSATFQLAGEELAVGWPAVNERHVEWKVKLKHADEWQLPRERWPHTSPHTEIERYLRFRGFDGRLTRREVKRRLRLLLTDVNPNLHFSERYLNLYSTETHAFPEFTLKLAAGDDHHHEPDDLYCPSRYRLHHSSPTPSAAMDGGKGPLAGMTMAIDPPLRGGAWRFYEVKQGIPAGRPHPCDLNFDIAWQLKERLEALGARVILTRERDDIVDLPAEHTGSLNELFVRIMRESLAMPSPSTLLVYFWKEALDALQLPDQNEARKALLFAYYKAVVASSDFVARAKLINQQLKGEPVDVFLSFYTAYRCPENEDSDALLYELYIPGAFMPMELGNVEERYHLVRLLTSDVLRQSCLLAKHLHAASMAQPAIAERAQARRDELGAQGRDGIAPYKATTCRKGERSKEVKPVLHKIHCGLEEEEDGDGQDEPIFARNLGMLRKVESKASCYMRLYDRDYDESLVDALVSAATAGLVHYWQHEANNPNPAWKQEAMMAGPSPTSDAESGVELGMAEGTAECF